jgi:hypothetical protein
MNIKAPITSLILASLFLAAGCTSTSHVKQADFKRPAGSRMIVMQPDVSAGVLTTGGLFEKREDWSKQALQNIAESISKFEASNSATTTKVVVTTEQTGADPRLVTELQRLHDAVGNSIRIHKFGTETLPTKKDRFDWTLGPSAVELGNQVKYDYAMFLYAKDSFASGGRKALQVAGLLACGVTGICLAAEGGAQVAFASLVDLRTGNVVWFNTLYSEVGDIRTPEGAEKLVTALLESGR